MIDPTYTATITVGGNGSSYFFNAFPKEMHSNQSFILSNIHNAASGGGFDISGATATLYVSAYKDTSYTPVALASGVISDSGSGTDDTVTFTVPKDVIPVDLGSYDIRNGGNSVFYYILEDVDSILEFSEGVNIIDPSFGLSGDSSPSSGAIVTQRNDLGSVEDTTVTTPPAQSLNLAYIVAVGSTGDWVGQDNNLAISNGSSWIFTLPEEGNFVFDKALGAQKVFNGSAWEVSAGGDMLASTYDPGNISEQLVGLTTSQTLSNKTVNGVTLTAAGSSSNFLNEAGNYVTVSSGGGFPTGRVTLSASTGTVNVDWDAGDTFIFPGGVLTGNTTLTFSNVLQGQTITIDVTGASGFTFDLPASCDISLEGTDFTEDVRNLVHIKAVNAATSQEYVYNLDTASSSGGGGFPSTDEDKTAAYTVVSGDIGKNVVFSGLSANVDCTLDVSLLSLGDQLGVINEDPTYSVRVIVSNTGTMTIATGTSIYLWEQETVLLGGNTATNARILARP